MNWPFRPTLPETTPTSAGLDLTEEQSHLIPPARQDGAFQASPPRALEPHWVEVMDSATD